MDHFHHDNTEGLTDEQLAEMNDHFNYHLTKAMARLPAGTEGGPDMHADIKRSLAEATRQHFATRSQTHDHPTGEDSTRE